MDTMLAVLIGLIVGGIALGMYMDWFGLWVSDDELKQMIARIANARLQEAGTDKAAETASKPAERAERASGTTF